MKIIKLEDGMLITFLPLPFDTDNFSFLHRGIYIGRFVFSTDSDIDKEILSMVFNSRNDEKNGTNAFTRYFSYVLHQNELVVATYGRKVHEMIKNTQLINDNFQFRQLEVVVKQVGPYPSYDYCKFTDEYYDIKYKNINEYLNSLTDEEKIYVKTYINQNSFTNKNNENRMSIFFNNNKLGDFSLFVRQHKIRKIKNKMECSH